MTESAKLQAQLRALADLAPRLEADGAADAFGTWVGSRETRPGVYTMPYVEFGELESAFRVAATGWVRPDIAWPAWSETADARALMQDPERLSRATPEDLAHVLTTLVRGDRFNEGLLLDAVERGLLARIARRAGALAAELAG